MKAKFRFPPALAQEIPGIKNRRERIPDDEARAAARLCAGEDDEQLRQLPDSAE